MDQTVVEFKAVSYTYPGRDMPVVDGIDLRLKRGEWLTVLGAGGAGKSTLARLSLGLIKASQGEVVRLPGLRAGYITQDPSDVLVGATVGEDVALGLAEVGLEPEQVRRRVVQALREVGLPVSYADKDPWSISGGEQQRAAIAGALLGASNLLVLDEPTSMLDRVARATVLSAISAARRRGIAILYITHDLSEALLGDKVLVLKHGRSLAKGRPQRLLRDSRVLASLEAEVPPLLQLETELQQVGVRLEPEGWTVQGWGRALAQKWGTRDES